MKWILRIGLAGLSLLAWMFRSAHSQKRETAVIQLSGNAVFSPFKLMFISDVHRRKLRSGMFNDKVDIVVIGGDFVERGVPAAPSLDRGSGRKSLSRGRAAAWRPGRRGERDRQHSSPRRRAGAASLP